jgi:hypothetical protein
LAKENCERIFFSSFSVLRCKKWRKSVLTAEPRFFFPMEGILPGKGLRRRSMSGRALAGFFARSQIFQILNQFPEAKTVPDGAFHTATL